MVAHIHPEGTDKIYCWTGDPECVPYHVSPAEKVANEEFYAARNSGAKLPTVRMSKAGFEQIMHETKGRKAWREEGILAPLKALAEGIKTAIEQLLGKLN